MRTGHHQMSRHFCAFFDEKTAGLVATQEKFWGGFTTRSEQSGRKQLDRYFPRNHKIFRRLSPSSSSRTTSSHRIAITAYVVMANLAMLPLLSFACWWLAWQSWRGNSKILLAFQSRYVSLCSSRKRVSRCCIKLFYKNVHCW